MNSRGWIYPLAILLLAGAYSIFVQPEGYRLARYYTPDGVIIPIGEDAMGMVARHFREIDGRGPALTSAIFQNNDPVVVTTDVGTGIMGVVPNDLATLLFDFKFLILMSAIYLCAALWFYQSTRDFHLTAFSLVVAFFLYTTVVVIGYHKLQFSWIMAGLLLMPALLNTGLRTTGKEVSGFLLIGESILVLFFGLITYVGMDDQTTLQNINNTVLILVTAILFVVSGLQLDNALRKTEDHIEKLKRWVLLGGTVFGLLIPFVAFQIIYRWFIPGVPIDYLLIVSLVFPVSLVYGTYRLHILPFQLILTRSLMAGLLTVFLVAIYAVALLIHGLLLPEQESHFQWIVNVIFLLTLVFFLDPARRAVSRFIESRVFRLDTRLTDSLKRIAQILSEHRRIQPAVNAYLQEIQLSLNLERTSFLFSSETFPELNIKHDRLRRISPDSPMWKYLVPDKMIVTAYLTFAGGDRQAMYQYLYRNRYMLAIGITGSRDGHESHGISGLLRGSILGANGKEQPALQEQQRISSALLVGFREDRRKLTLKEIRYLHEAAKLAGLLIYNYALLVREIEKRQQMREINLAGQLQRSLASSSEEENYSNIQIAHISRAAISVTGDYLDLIPISRSRFALFLGDVSGHGLGTGYLASTIRSIVRSHMRNKSTLLETVQTVNHFLMDRYEGSEFITLFAMVMDTDNGKVEYINAAHPGPYIIESDGRFQQLEGTQRLIGVLPTPYHTSELTLEANQRLFIYSDGVTETFDRNDIAFGEDGLETFLERHARDDPQDLMIALTEALDDYRQGSDLSDDTTFLLLEYTPRFNPVRSLLNLLGFDR